MEFAGEPETTDPDLRAGGHPHLPDPEVHSRVVGYLRHAPRLSPQFHTDGVWVWPAGLADTTAARGSGPQVQLLDHIAARGYLLPDVISDTGLESAADRVLGPPTPVPAQALTFLVDRDEDPMRVIRIRPDATGRVAEIFTPRGWRRVPDVPATFRDASPRSVDSYLDGLSRRWRQDQARLRDAESETPAAGVRLARLFDAATPENLPRFSPGRRRLIDANRREQIARYLGAGRLVIRSTSRMADPLGGPGAAPVPLGFRTDGMWVWPEGLAHYVRSRGVAPELALLMHLEERAYRLRADLGDADVRAAVAAVRAGPRPQPDPDPFRYYADATGARILRAPVVPGPSVFSLEVLEPDLRWNAEFGGRSALPGADDLAEITEEQAIALLDRRWAALAGVPL
jgi:hypothetical protein